MSFCADAPCAVGSPAALNLAAEGLAAPRQLESSAIPPQQGAYFGLERFFFRGLLGESIPFCGWSVDAGPGLRELLESAAAGEMEAFVRMKPAPDPRRPASLPTGNNAGLRQAKRRKVGRPWT